MTELRFLIHLLLEHKLPTETKKLIADRISQVETNLNAGPRSVQFTPGTIATYQRPLPTAQAPSTQRILDAIQEDSQTPEQLNQQIDRVVNAPNPTVIAQTPAAAAALAARQEAIRIATSGKEEKGRTAPRKF